MSDSEDEFFYNILVPDLLLFAVAISAVFGLMLAYF